MELANIIAFRENEKNYNYLKANSWYFKELNRRTKNYNDFATEMKAKYKERTSDKLVNVIDNIDMISSVLNVLK